MSRRARLGMEQLEARDTPATISGTAFYDANANGVRDGAEGVALGVAVSAGIVNGVLTDTTTDITGHYELTGLPTGSYTVTFSPQPGYALSTPVGGQLTINLGAANAVVDAGMVPSSGSGSGIVSGI